MKEGDFCRLRYRGTTATTEIVRFIGESETHYRIAVAGKDWNASYSKAKWEILETEVPPDSPLQRAFEVYDEDLRRSIQAARDRDERDRG